MNSINNIYAGQSELCAGECEVYNRDGELYTGRSESIEHTMSSVLNTM